MRRSFRAVRSRGLHLRYQINLTGANGGHWYVTVDDAHYTIAHGTVPSSHRNRRIVQHPIQPSLPGHIRQLAGFALALGEPFEENPSARGVNGGAGLRRE